MFKRLTLEQRYQTMSLLEAGLTQSEIAEEVGVDKSTISREIKRNKVSGRYNAKAANEKAKLRQTVFHKHIKITWEMILLITKKLSEGWSPEQIYGHYKKYNIAMVSHETIYQHIAKNRAAGGDLYKRLRRKGRRKKHYGHYSLRGQIKNRISIDQRPEIVEEKKRFGDLEGDLVIGKGHCGVILTIVDRATKFTWAVSLSNKSARTVADAIINLFYPFVGFLKTLTFDNGKEFSFHEEIAKALKIDIYFADPYCSWQRGLNENTNGLLREYLPKQMSFKSLPENKVRDVVIKLNNRPRKILNFSTPQQVFEKLCV